MDWMRYQLPSEVPSIHPLLVWLWNYQKWRSGGILVMNRLIVRAGFYFPWILVSSIPILASMEPFLHSPLLHTVCFYWSFHSSRADRLWPSHLALVRSVVTGLWEYVKLEFWNYQVLNSVIIFVWIWPEVHSSCARPKTLSEVEINLWLWKQMRVLSCRVPYRGPRRWWRWKWQEYRKYSTDCKYK